MHLRVEFKSQKSKIAIVGLGYHGGDFLIAEKAGNEVLSLPFHPYLNEEVQGKIAEAMLQG